MSLSAKTVLSVHMCNHAQVAFKELKLDLEFLTWGKISFQTGQKKPLMERFQVQRCVGRYRQYFKIDALARADFGIDS